MSAFSFHARFIDVDELVLRLAFADEIDASAEHYLVFDRSEEFRDEAIPGMENVYLELDDQQWGGFGGIARVVLLRQGLTFLLEPPMAAKMGNHDAIQLSFATDDGTFNKLSRVLKSIMKGYEERLEAP